MTKMRPMKLLVKAFKSIVFPANPSPPYSHICQIGDPVLRMKTKLIVPEEISSPRVQKIISQLLKVMKEYSCLSLAAPQIGVPESIFVLAPPKQIKNDKMNRQMEFTKKTVFINPIMKITNYKKYSLTENCQSMCGFSATVPRYREVKVTALNELGEEKCYDLSGWTARVVQHEMDHLNGILYVDNMDKNSFQNDAWHRINIKRGKIKLRFDGR